MSTTNPTEIPTEWEELQIKYGNYAPRPPAITNEELSNTAIDFAEQQDVLVNKSLKELERMEDEVDEDTLEAYRKQRLAELKRKQEAYKFGDVVHVGKAEYIKEITEASQAPGNPVVVLHMYSNSKPICTLINRALSVLARKHGYVKFCKAIGADVVQDLPESRVPTVLIYKGGKCLRQFVGGSVWGGEQLTTESVEWVLWKNAVLDSAADEEDPRPKSHRNNVSKKSKIRYDANDRTQHDEESCDDEDDEEDKDVNVDRRGYASLALEKALRLKMVEESATTFSSQQGNATGGGTNAGLSLPSKNNALRREEELAMLGQDITLQMFFPKDKAKESNEVGFIKILLSEQCGISARNIKLFFNGKEMLDPMSLCDHAGLIPPQVDISVLLV